MIRVAHKTEVSSHFIDTMRSAFEHYVKHKSRFTASKQWTKKFGPLVAAKKKILTDPMALDFEITRLRSLPYTAFSVIMHSNDNGNTTYLSGMTNPVIVEHRGEMWNLDQYQIYIPSTVFAGGNIDRVHMTPMKNPNAIKRHMHHICYPTTYSAPLDQIPHTCWGGFGGIAAGCANDCDIVEIFRCLYSFLTNYNSASPLYPIEEIDWKKRVTA